MDDKKSFLMPEAASTIADGVDALYYFLVWLSVFFFVLIIGLMVFFVIRYRRRSETDTTPHISHSSLLEIAWSVIPLGLIVILFIWGFNVYMGMRVAPHGAMEVHVTGQKWSWLFEYPDGTVTSKLGVPINKPVKLIMSSQDVIHSFFVPSFRQKMDVLPNRYTTTWFEATREGIFPIYCTEDCGKGHSDMLSEVIVMPEEKYKEWLLTGGLGDTSQLSLADYGAMLYKARQCDTCHSVDGSENTGPTFKGLYGKQEKLIDGTEIEVDENYVRESIMNPNARVAVGYQPVMPTYRGSLKDRDVNALIEYIKSLRE